MPESTVPTPAEEKPAILRRSPIGLIRAWALVLCGAGALYWLQTVAPAFRELFIPFYVILGITGGVYTWRWLRFRSPKNRRSADRRRSERRDSREE